ncbi:adenylate/guanylate cyclase domain-containing protein [Ramlibacter sp.]|uniref:adenylate/guanylate cyclase domain-containing protein n=1 Tax=Ramlibacter sp. TaxID=1917967 RepID=UPI003D102F0E
MLTSKDILERTGISRATLNNYIASGLVPRPEVLPPGPHDGAAPRIGYFPDDTLERIETIQRLKREGWSLARMAERFAGGGTPEALDPRPRGDDDPPGLAASATVPHPPVNSAEAGIQGFPEPAPTHPPALTPVAILVTTLEDASGLWIQLTAAEYFELVNELWSELDRIFRAHGGQPRRHPDEGMTSCFSGPAGGGYVWSALAAAHEVRLAMRQVSARWQQRKAWPQPLHMNTGLDAGEDWVGVIGRFGRGDLRVLGEAAHRAEQLSRCGAGGSILVTRGLVGKLAPAQQRRVAFGVGGSAGGTPLHARFSRLAGLGLPHPVPAGLADLAVAEVFDIRPPE